MHILKEIYPLVKRKIFSIVSNNGLEVRSISQGHGFDAIEVMLKVPGKKMFPPDLKISGYASALGGDRYNVKLEFPTKGTSSEEGFLTFDSRKDAKEIIKSIEKVFKKEARGLTTLTTGM